MCPNQCTCQHQSFASAPQSHWIDVSVSQDHPFADPEANIKTIMCIVQNEFGFRDIVPSIPGDVQALTFLFTGGSNQNVTESEYFRVQSNQPLFHNPFQCTWVT